MLIAGDDADAKHALAEVVRAGGVTAVDAGSLTRARELEAVGFLQLTLAVQEKIGWTGGFARRRVADSGGAAQVPQLRTNGCLGCDLAPRHPCLRRRRR